MIVKEKFDLKYQEFGETFNVLPFSETTLQPYAYNTDEVKYFYSLIQAYSKSKPNKIYDKLKDKLPYVMFVNFPQYPLPASILQNGRIIVNLNPLQLTDISDISIVDIFSTTLYGLVLQYFMIKRPMTIDIEPQITDYFFSIFMKMFGKKSGLVGSFKTLIPQLKLFISLYVHTAFFNVNPNILVKRQANKYGADLSTISLNPKYPINTLTGMLSHINENKIISISENKFSTYVIRYGGVESLPIFEDLSRLIATLMVVETTYGRSLFGNTWKNIGKEEYNKILSTSFSKIK